MARRANIRGDKPTFKYIHLMAPHPPLRFNERLEYEVMEYSRHNFIRQAKGTLELVHILLNALREVGAYDKTMIVVLADHGLNRGIRIEASGHTESGKPRYAIPDAVKSGSLPLFLVKPFGVAGALKISDVPVSLSDVTHTIATELGIESEFPGASIFKLADSKGRSRRFLYHVWGPEYKDKEYLPPLKEYFVSGFSWLDESWTPTYRVFTTDGVTYSPPQTYTYGTEIRFGAGDDSLQYQGGGWGSPQDGFTWTVATKAVLVIPISNTGTEIELRAQFTPFTVPGKLRSQRVNIIANGTPLGEWAVKDASRVSETFQRQEGRIVIPRGLVADSVLAVTFQLPDATVPADVGVDQESRPVGIAMRSVVLTQPVDEGGM